MANDFKKAVQSSIGVTASPTSLYTVPSGKTSILIELDLCNKTNASVPVSYTHLTLPTTVIV